MKTRRLELADRVPIFACDAGTRWRLVRPEVSKQFRNYPSTETEMNLKSERLHNRGIGDGWPRLVDGSLGSPPPGDETAHGRPSRKSISASFASMSCSVNFSLSRRISAIAMAANVSRSHCFSSIAILRRKSPTSACASPAENFASEAFRLDCSMRLV